MKKQTNVKSVSRKTAARNGRPRPGGQGRAPRPADAERPPGTGGRGFGQACQFSALRNSLFPRKNSASASFKKPASAAKLANVVRPKKPSVRQPVRRPRAFLSPPAPSRLAATRRPRPRRRARPPGRRRACTGPFPSLAQPRPRSASDARSTSRGPRRSSAGHAGTSSTLAARNVPVRRPRPRTRAASSHRPSLRARKSSARRSLHSSRLH